ncbi:MAG TPA: hypothetical protein VGM77_06955 [Gemmatimonadales bacterium]|jgi:hypothetical protein
MLELGRPSGKDQQSFLDVVALARLHNGVIVVASSSSNELRFYAANGRFMASAGRKGSGPGEFRTLRGVFVVGDTIVAVDASLPASKFSFAGKFLGTVPRPKSAAGLPQLLAYFHDGSQVLDRTYPFNQRASDGVVPVYGAIYKVAPNQSITMLVDRLQLASLQGTPTGPRPVAFQARLVVTGSPSGLCTAYTDRYIVSCVDINGRPSTRTEWHKVVVPVTAANKDAFVKAVASHPVRSEDGFGTRQTIAPLFAKSWPLIAVIRRTADNELWVQSYSMGAAVMATGSPPAPTDPTDWTVFGPDGAMLASITLPRRFVPFEMGRDYVLGVLRDDDDVEVVTLYRLVRG